MSTLTGQQIQNSYQGLLKLADSTTGITQNFQSIQDGLGNDTGITIAEDYLAAPNIFNLLPLKNDYFGVGFNTQGVAPVAGTQNTVISEYFYDQGQYSYSAITYYVHTLSTIDTVDVAFYTAQSFEGLGIVPHQLVQSGITLDVSSTGVKTTTLPSSLSFSGYGGALYFMCMKISNSGVTPTVRFSAPQIGTLQTGALMGFRYGFQFSPTGSNVLVPASQVGSNGTTTIFFSSLDFKTTYVKTDFTVNGSTNAPTYGFALKTEY